ncbi:MAG: hypothetical protein K2H02_05490 [Anaeroplasmataceae bacterium]|nr:hypothetical protein [Anaeroplasmataceae bacterium]
MKKFLKWLKIAIETALIFIVSGAVTTAITKNIYAEVLINQFKKKGVLDEEHSTDKLKVYKIASDEDRSTVLEGYYPGRQGDILISLKSELTIPFVTEFISFFAGGHAGLVLGDYEDYLDETTEENTLESTAVGGSDFASVDEKNDYWIDNSPYKEVICLRVKTTEQERKRVLAEAMALAGDPYNYSFILGTKNRSYCSDVIAKAYSKIGVNLNKDGFTTSIYDLLISNETYISYYHYIDNYGVKYIYYLA